jgi:hypothetical protein
MVAMMFHCMDLAPRSPWPSEGKVEGLLALCVKIVQPCALSAFDIKLGMVCCSLYMMPSMNMDMHGDTFCAGPHGAYFQHCRTLMHAHADLLWCLARCQACASHGDAKHPSLHAPPSAAAGRPMQVTLSDTRLVCLE